MEALILYITVGPIGLIILGYLLIFDKQKQKKHTN